MIGAFLFLMMTFSHGEAASRPDVKFASLHMLQTQDNSILTLAQSLRRNLIGRKFVERSTEMTDDGGRLEIEEVNEYNNLRVDGNLIRFDHVWSAEEFLFAQFEDRSRRSQKRSPPLSHEKKRTTRECVIGRSSVTQHLHASCFNKEMLWTPPLGSSNGSLVADLLVRRGSLNLGAWFESLLEEQGVPKIDRHDDWLL